MTKRTALLTSLMVCICIAAAGCPQQKDTAATIGKNGKVVFNKILPIEKSAYITATIDKSKSYKWSTGKGTILSTEKTNQYVRYEVLVGDDEPRTITFYGVQDSHFCRYRSAVNEKATGKMVEFYGRKGARTTPVVLGTFKPKDGKLSIVFVCVGANPKSTGEKYGAGLDYILITKPQAE